jgi:hypothetical protein
VVDRPRVRSQTEYGDRDRPPTGLFRQARQLGDTFLDGGIAAASNRHPFVAVVDDPPQRVRAVTAYDDWRMGLLDGFGPLPDTVELHELAMELGLVLGPDLLHGQDSLAHQLEAAGGIGAVVGHLLQVPAPAHPEQEASA